MPEEYIENWDDERDSILDDARDQDRDMRDDVQTQDFDGSLSFNPQSFREYTKTYTQDDILNPPLRTLVVGPVFFEAPFSSAPNISLTQVAEIGGEGLSSVVATTEAPFMCIPYVRAWNFNNGVVDGFWLGLYALTVPPASLAKHTISWRAIGPASAYYDLGVTESWTESYDQGDADFLIEDSTDESADDYFDAND